MVNNEQDLLPQPAFGERLRWLRQRRGLKQSDLADNRGLSASYVSRIESGSRAVTPHVAELIAARLGVDISVFMISREAEMGRLVAEGQAYLTVGDHLHAAGAFETALGKGRHLPFALAWAIKQGLVMAYSNLGRLDDWHRHQRDLVELAEESAAPCLLVQAQVGLSNCLRLRGEMSAAYAAARAGHDAAEPEGVPNELRIQAFIALLATEVESGRATDAVQHAEKMLDLLRADTPAALRAQARWAAATTLASRGHHQEAVALLDAAVADLPSGDDLITWARLRLAAVSIRQRAGQPLSDTARAAYAEAATVLRLAAIPIYVAQLDVIEARIAADEGRYADAKAHCDAALTEPHLLMFRDQARARMLRAGMTAELGDPEQALRDLREVAQQMNEAGALDLAAEAWQMVADLALTHRGLSS